MAQKSNFTDFYKTLIIITTIISIFFFGRYIYNKIPKFEVKEKIITGDMAHCSDYYIIENHCETNNFSDKTDEKIEEKTGHLKILKSFCSKRSCYVKYKVKK